MVALGSPSALCILVDDRNPISEATSALPGLPPTAPTDELQGPRAQQG